MDKLIIFVGYIFQLSNIFFRKLFNFKGIKIGVEEGEIGIKVGSSIALYGIISVDKLKFYVEKPQYLLKSHKSLIQEKLNDLISSYGILTLFLGTSVIAGYFAIRRINRIYRQ